MNGEKEWPDGWRIWLEGAVVHFEVPASAADGEFELSRSEAGAVGRVLLLLSALPHAREEPTEPEIGQLLDDRFGISLDEFLAVLRRLPAMRPWDTAGADDAARSPRFVEEARRQSAVVAESGSASGNQGRVDDTSEFSEDPIRDREPEAGEQE